MENGPWHSDNLTYEKKPQGRARNTRKTSESKLLSLLAAASSFHQIKGIQPAADRRATPSVQRPADRDLHRPDRSGCRTAEPPNTPDKTHPTAGPVNSLVAARRFSCAPLTGCVGVHTGCSANPAVAGPAVLSERPIVRSSGFPAHQPAGLPADFTVACRSCLCIVPWCPPDADLCVISPGVTLSRQSELTGVRPVTIKSTGRRATCRSLRDWPGADA